jgi:hypothetical protein
MKSDGTNKELKYSLQNIDNYKKELENNIEEVTTKYSTLVAEYYKFILENIQLKNKAFARFIIIRGLDTITNVFLLILLYTKNIDITFFHCQKSFYFYVEFVGQIAEDDKVFLQLSSRDATTYVYKKTIFTINNEHKKQTEFMSNITKDKINIINSYIDLYKIYINKILRLTNFDTNTQYINAFNNLFSKLNNNLINQQKIKNLENIVNKLDNIIDDIDKFFDINQHIIKRFLKNNEILDNCNYHEKISSDIFTEKIKGPVDKFVIWFLN